MSQIPSNKIVDLLTDERFIEWVSEGKHQSFWENWVEEEPNREILIREAKLIVESLSIKANSGISDEEIQEMVNAVEKRRNQPVIELANSKRMFPWRSVAAAVLLIAVAGIYFLTREFKLSTLTHNVEYKPSANDVRITNENTSSMLVFLPDESSVVLQKGSEIRYSSDFTKSSRNIELVGEAFFEVKKDSLRPFSVFSGDIITTVLGTSFTVRAFLGEERASVLVRSGKVSVMHNSDDAVSVILTPNEQVVFDKKTADFSKKTLVADSSAGTGLSKYGMVFVDTPLSAVLSELSSAYHVEFTYNVSAIGSCPITASLSGQSLYEKIRVVSAALGAEFSVKNGVVHLEGGGCR